MSKRLIFCIFANDNKTAGTVIQKDLFEFFQKMVWFIDFGVTICEIPRVDKYLKNC